jgi:hypothetical protein
MADMNALSAKTQVALETLKAKKRELVDAMMPDIKALLFDEVRKYVPNVDKIVLVRRNEYNDEGYDDELRIEAYIDDEEVDMYELIVGTEKRMSWRRVEYDADVYMHEAIKPFLESLHGAVGALLDFDDEMTFTAKEEA